ncbi:MULTISPECIES: peptidase domain-containing ABC transporter [unclassified Tolypothrix]|uniref:peptidase domain-containing ABC transporter n=1 Tax=unclassified Tolypothrix TaxID=2649714 RepID=UPI0005EAA37F|nr:MULTISPECIES: peptidase domain-containing ABC transporter [unclassified Tolypothrix]BAY93577.1 ABC transporter ATP-binding protein [Microchaete diplosiphon NIES-3275]EKE99638.1 ABC transporter, ATP-binding protein [Tolypothrix sp. PCC 7601]MBE9082400.1 peptidase domain-containing ABC transporter [Tolypothrix sp. LEGE 11397]UYD27404.1 peptidase domain-containing ABC transporter [Tolypothrix sp. PCC 7712]UYD36731.1 peptidase domain-containing ABC transporter [Tolypothrix sp. PCC 7601]
MRYKFVKQHSEEDCGAACIATIAKHYGHNFTLTHIREAVGTGQFGTTLLGLRRGAEILGFNTRPVKTSPELLNRMHEAPLPAIIHWKGNHWVVLYGKKGKKCLIADPAVGIRHLSKKDLAEGWTDWLMLLLEPDPVRFFAQKDDNIGGFWRFFKRVWNYRAILAQAFPLNLILGLLSLASPFLLQILTDDVLVRGDTSLLTTVAISVVVMNFISSSLSFVQSNLIANFAQRLQLGMVMEFGRQILRLPLTYYETRRSGEIVSRLQDIEQINQLVAQVVVGLPSKFFIAIISLGLMIFYSWKLTVVAVFISIAMTLSTIVFQPTLQQKTRELLVTEAETQGLLVETFKGALTLKTTASAPQFWDELQHRFGRLGNLTFRTMQIGIINNTFSGFISAIGAVVLLWFGGNLVINPDENLSIGQLMAFNSMNGNFLGLIATVISFVEEFTRAKTATQRLTEVIDATPENEGDGRKPLAYIANDANIICTNLSFHYAGRLDLLDNFSLTIPGGQVVALIGKSGCGKSTLAKLIAGLYQLQSGNIQIGIYNIQDLSLDCLRQQIVLVPQDAHFWNRSIVENFRLGTPHISFEQIVRACQIAGADEFINKFPEKYQTILGEFGANISGGQRQRLAIARAIVTDPPVLILDESTGGLDPVSEAQVLDRLFEHRQGKTTILITHRPKVINRADWVVLLENGKLKLQGSLKDLISQPGDHLDFLIP